MLRKRPGGVLDCLTVKGSLSVSVLGSNRASPELLSQCPGCLGADRAADGITQAPGDWSEAPGAWAVLCWALSSSVGADGPGSSRPAQPALRLPLDSGPRKQLLPQLCPGGSHPFSSCHRRLNSHVGGCVLDCDSWSYPWGGGGGWAALAHQVIGDSVREKSSLPFHGFSPKLFSQTPW